MKSAEEWTLIHRNISLDQDYYKSIIRAVQKDALEGAQQEVEKHRVPHADDTWDSAWNRSIDCAVAHVRALIPKEPT
jgi:hypothetical protein